MVVFVCDFNVHRSVSAEYLLRKLLQQRFSKLSKEIEVSSAGLPTQEIVQRMNQKGVPLPVFGRGSSRQIREIAFRKGITLSTHKSKLFNRDLAERADLIITMGIFHKREVLAQYPQSYGKVLTFREIFDISGPLIVEDSLIVPNYDPDTHEHVHSYELEEQMMEEIKRCFNQGAEKILGFLNLTQ
jgi:protein-tyrosine phosphatase